VTRHDHSFIFNGSTVCFVSRGLAITSWAGFPLCSFKNDVFSVDPPLKCNKQITTSLCWCISDLVQSNHLPQQYVGVFQNWLNPRECWANTSSFVEEFFRMFCSEYYMFRCLWKTKCALFIHCVITLPSYSKVLFIFTFYLLHTFSVVFQFLINHVIIDLRSLNSWSCSIDRQVSQRCLISTIVTFVLWYSIHSPMKLFALCSCFYWSLITS